MYNIEYSIDLNKQGRPYIKLPENNENNPEDRFFSIEMTRYILYDAFKRRSKQFDEEVNKKLNITISVLQDISDEIANILYNQMKTMAEFTEVIDSKYHIQVQTIKDRNKLQLDNILYNNKIYERKIGLKVLVLDEMNIYELVNGIENSNWIKI